MLKDINTKPHIIVKLAYVNGKEQVSSATLYRNNLSPVNLNPQKVKQILNKSQESKYEYLGQNRFMITDSKIIAKLGTPKVKRVSKYVGPVIATLLLISVLTNTPSTKEVNTEDTKPSVEEFLTTRSQEEERHILQEEHIQLVKEEIARKQEERKKIEEQTYSFDYKDRTGYTNYSYTVENYSESIRKNAEIFGLDPALITAMISHENPFNEQNTKSKGARGVTQIENCWWGNTITSYRFDTKEKETVTIDGDRLNKDPDYAIEIGCRILNFNYHDIYQEFVTTGILTNKEAAIASLIAYNRGLYGTKDLIDKYGSDFFNHLNEIKYGYNLYVERVFSYIPDGTPITFLNQDGTEETIYIDNLNVNTFKK